MFQLTNKLVSKGYITSIATVSDKNDLTIGTLKLKNCRREN
ncbi:POTRA domain-containing protein [Leptotrichia sp. oral taxon 847]